MTQTLTKPDLRGISVSDLRDHVAGRLTHSPEDHDGDYRLNPEFREWVMQRAVKDAAVLIAFREDRDGFQVLLTKRTEKLKSHSGQISFPGGKIDPDDAGPVAAALREAEEEVNVPTQMFDVIGEMPPYFSGSGFKIHPVIAFMDKHAEPSPNPDEVEYIFETPLDFLMDPANHKTASRMFNGKERYYLEMPYRDHYIWGVTAGIIHSLYERVFK